MQHKQKLLNNENNWNELKNYKPNDVVSDDGKLWQNVSGINTKPGSISNNDWVVIDDSIDYAKVDFVNDEIDKIKDFATAGIVGSINPSTDTTNLPDGVYNVQISGTYPNASNIVVKEGYYTLLRKVGDVWILESEVKIPTQDLSVIEGKITDVENGVDSLTDKVDDVLKGFFDQTIDGEEIKYTASKGFLYTNNIVAYSGSYPVSYVHNLPLNRDYIVSGVAMDSGNNVATLLGIKDGIITNLILGLSEGDKYTILVKKDQYDLISIGFHNSTPPTIYSDGVTIENIDAKKYIDERLIVLDSFLQTEEIAWEE